MNHKTSSDKGHPKVQTDQVDFKFIFNLLVGLFIFVVITMVAIWKLVDREKNEAYVKPYIQGQADSFSIGQAPSSAASAPRLQVDEHYDLETYVREETKKLKTYGWVNKSRGLVRVPIEEAMDKVVQELPSRK